jgi:hypothetical protein
MQLKNVEIWILKKKKKKKKRFPFLFFFLFFWQSLFFFLNICFLVKVKLYGQSSLTQIYGKLDSLQLDEKKPNQQTSSKDTKPTLPLATTATTTAMMDISTTDDGLLSETKGPKLLSHLPLIRTQTATKLANFFEGPSHTLPTPSSSFWTLMEMIIPKTNTPDMKSEQIQIENRSEDSNVILQQQQQQQQNQQVISALSQVDQHQQVSFSCFTFFESVLSIQ